MLAFLLGLMAGPPGAPWVASVAVADSPPTHGPAKAANGGILGRPLRVGLVSWPGYVGGIVANNGFKPDRRSIFWQKYGLAVEFSLIEDADVRAKLFARGGVDVVWSTVDFWAYELPGFIKGGIAAKAVMQVDWSRGGDAIVADSNIHTLEDLKGHRIALAEFTPSHWLLEYCLEHSLLSDDQQTTIMEKLIAVNASPDARDIFVKDPQHSVEAAVMWEPDVTLALKDRSGSHILVSSKAYPNIIADIMVARDDFIHEHPDAIGAFVTGWLDGVKVASQDSSLAVRLLMENEPLYKELGPAVTRRNLDVVKWADLSDNVKMFGLSGGQPLFDQIFDQVSAAWVKRGYITSRATAGQAKDDRFVRAVYSDARSGGSEH